MKPFSKNQRSADLQICLRAFTLVEVQIAMAIFGLVLAAVMSSHVFGLKLNEATRAKLSASDAARKAIGRLAVDIRSAKSIQIGGGSNFASFASVADGLTQQGSCIRIFPTTNTNSYVVYFRDPSDKKLKRAETGGASPIVVAEFLTNTVIFTSENFKGQPLVDNENNRVIGVNLRFYQIQYPETTVGLGGYFDYYQVNTKITRRTVE